MKKLLRGILDFRKNVLPGRKELFAKLATGQDPDVLFITCSDSRVAPNWFASTDPGDLFVIRNVGNLVPPCNPESALDADHSVAAAIEFSLLNLKITDIVVCGHSGCGAMHALSKGLTSASHPNLKQWIRFAEPSLGKTGIQFESKLSKEDKLSQANVLQQLTHLKSYPVIDEKVKKGQLRLHGWWFEIAEGGVYAFEENLSKFSLIDDRLAAPFLKGSKN